MSGAALLPRGPQALAAVPLAAQALAAQPLAAWRVMPGALMLLGRAPAPPPKDGPALVQQSPALRGAFRTVAWPATGGGCAFLAAIRLSGGADPAAGAAVALRGPAACVALTLPSGDEDAAFGQRAAEHAGAHAPAVARFLLETLRAPGGQTGPSAAVMLRAFLSRAAAPDGCIEIMAAVPGSCVALQGWGARIGGPVQVVLAGAALPVFAGFGADFARADIVAPATGIMLALPAEAAGALPGVDHVFVVSDQGLHSRALVEHRLLDPAASVGHIRHMLPSLRAPAPMRALLEGALRPRYDGVDTLSGNARPVRAAFDTACAGAGAGAYLSGWVFDPARLIAELHLCDETGELARLDGDWTRVPRPDVVAAFQDAPGFPAPAGDLWGVAAATPAVPGPGPHLRIAFTDGDRAFLPLQMSNAAEPARQAALLAGVDLFKPSGVPVLERQAAPFFARLSPARAHPVTALAGPVERPHALVTALAAAAPPRALLSGYLHEPADETEQIVLVCGPAWDAQQIEALRGLLRFYALPATILTAAEATPAAALHAACAATGAATLTLATPTLAARTPDSNAGGWRAALRAAGQGHLRSAAFVCPTLLYEDWSIRYAGAAELAFQDAAPWAELRPRLAGLPAALAAGAGPQPASTGTLACCLMTREAAALADGPGAFATEAGQEAAFFQRLAAAGLAGVWAPSVQMVAPEDGAEPTRAARLVDGWMLRHAALAGGRPCAS